MPIDTLINSATGNTIIKSNVNMIGKMVINEPSSTTGSGTDATLLINHATAGGSSSIVFTSATNRGAGADYAYIRYSDNRDNNTTSENSLLTIGVDNDAASPNLVHVDNMKLAPSGWLDITGNTNILSTLPSSSTTTGALTVTGGVGIGGNMNVGGNVNAVSALITGDTTVTGATRLTNNTASTSTSTGALVVTTGGVGVAGNLYVGGSIISQSITPAGSIMAYLGTSPDPTGWVIADGVPRTYSTIYSTLIGMSIRKTGETGTTTYTPPDYKGAFLRGTGANGVYSGPAVGVSQNHATQTHSHGVTQTPHGHSFNANGGGSGTLVTATINGSVGTLSTSNSNVNISIDNSTLNVNPNETRPYNFGVNWIIKL